MSEPTPPSWAVPLARANPRLVRGAQRAPRLGWDPLAELERAAAECPNNPKLDDPAPDLQARLERIELWIDCGCPACRRRAWEARGRPDPVPGPEISAAPVAAGLYRRLVSRLVSPRGWFWILYAPAVLGAYAALAVWSLKRLL